MPYVTRRVSLRHICALALLIALGLPSRAIAAPSASAIADKRAQAAQAAAEMRRMQSGLQAGMSDYAKVSGQLAATRREIDANTGRLKTLQRRLGTIGARLNDRASYMYRTSDAGPLDVLFGATSFDEFIARMDFLTRVAEEDAGLILEAKHGREEARRLRTGLTQREADLVRLRDRSAAQRDKLAGDLAKQKAYFAALSADVVTLLAQQERANRPPPAAAPSSGGGGGGTGPRPHSGNGLAVATVDGRSGSYYVMGGEPQHYRPSEPSGVTQASTYSVSDNGGTGTSSGRPLDDSDLTCACSPGLGLSFGTHVAITHGGRRVIVVVTDRGPFSPPGRDFDLTTRAASLLGLDGVGDVHYEVVVPAS
jgi:peptidoglycan hydrolase CwlO-like protein